MSAEDSILFYCLILNKKYMKHDANWIKQPINHNNLFKSYEDKYGINSDFSKWQEIIFADKDVRDNLSRALNDIDLDQGNILDIGINNAFEIGVIKELKGLINWDNIKITGIDLSKTALKIAKNNLKDIKHELLFGNILEFNGQDINSNQKVNLADNHFDACFAITSLQSTGIFNNNFASFANDLIKKMKNRSYFLVMVPNCYIENGQLKEGGAFNAEKQAPDKNFAPNFVKEFSLILQDNNYKVDSFGDKFLFILAKRYAKK